MTHRVRGALGRCSPSSVALLLLAASSLAAQQTTGKIEGTVTDPAGVPIASATVLIVGTAFGTATDQKGYYFLINVPVGTYTVRGQFLGYAVSEVTGVRVAGGQTMTVNIRMQPSAVAVAGVVVTAEVNPIVPRDQVTSKVIITNISRLPIDDVRQIVALTPGVVESGNANGLVLRGGRPGEANVYIDGAPVRSTAFGSQLVQINRNAVEEASVTTGAIGVEFGDAQSGIISYTSKAGGPKYEGAASYESDEPFGNSISVGFNRFEGSLGGPVPGISKLTFYASGVLQGQVSPITSLGQDTIPTFVLGGIDTTVSVALSNGTGTQTVAIPRFVQYGGDCPGGSDATNAARDAILKNYGFDCQGRRLPLAWNTQYQAQGKLAYSYGSGSNISLTGVANQTQFRNYPGFFGGNGSPHGAGSNIVDPSLYSGERDWSKLAILNWNHSVFKTADRALALNVNLSWGQDNRFAGPLDPAYEISTRSPTGGVELKTMQFINLGAYPFPITDDIIANIRANTGLRVPYLQRSDLLLSQPYRMNPYGLSSSTGWPTVGSDAVIDLYHENRYRAFGQVDWQANRFHRFNLGGEYKKSDLSRFRSDIIDEFGMTAYIAHPYTYAFWAADRLDLGDVVIEVGGRWDYMNTRALFPNTPGRISSSPATIWSPLAASNADSLAASIARAFTPAVGHHTISPRLRVSFPITEKTDFRLSYAYQVNTPEFNTLLRGTNNDLTYTNSNDFFGRDVNFGKTILFEFGVRHAFSQDLVLDVSAYNKDFVSDLAYRVKKFPNPATPGTLLDLNVLTNADFGYARGIDVNLDRRIGDWLRTRVAYTFQVARSTGSDPFSYIQTSARAFHALLNVQTPPPEQPLPTNDNRAHNIVGSATLTVPADWRKGTVLGSVLRDVGASLTFRAVSGLPYTRVLNAGQGQTAPFLRFGPSGELIEPINSSTMPWNKFLDVRVNKGFKVGRLDWTLFADARNVLNFRNVTSLFVETGDVTNPKNRQLQLANEFAQLQNEASLNGALLANGDVDLKSIPCSSWSGDAGPVDCVMLQRTEARWGDGDGIYSVKEQQRTLDAWYNSFNGVQRFLGPPRQVRVGAEVSF